MSNKSPVACAGIVVACHLSVQRLQNAVSGRVRAICARMVLANMPARAHVGTIASTKVELITRFRSVAEDGGVIELVVWRVPRSVPPTEHGYKYRAVCAVDGVRAVGFDNERGKGDHCHLHGRELPYTFTTVDAQVEDFIAAVDVARSKP